METKNPYVCCIGAATQDRTYKLFQRGAVGTSNPATMHLNCGGVARNVAENLARLGIGSSLISVVGVDEAGRAVIEHTRRHGVDTRTVTELPDHSTGSYVAAIEPDGELFTGISDLEICAALDATLIDRHWDLISGAHAVFADTNAPRATLAYLLERVNAQPVPLFVDAVSVSKAARLPQKLHGIEVLFCNLAEAQAIAGSSAAPQDGRLLARSLLARGAACAVVTAGADGLWRATRKECILLPALPGPVVDVSGAGDALIATTIAARMTGYDCTASLRMGLRAASLTIQSLGPGGPRLSLKALAAD